MVISAKIILIGDSAVGKTTLRDKYMGKKFNSNYIPTLGADFVGKTALIKTNSGWKEINFQIWDLAGQPTFKQTRAMYYRGAYGALLLFDINSSESFHNLENWMEELTKNVKSSQIILCIIGNKIDLRSDSSITTKEAKKTIQENITQKYPLVNKDVIYVETSAKTGENVNRAFQALGEKILDLSQINKK
ncbi:MAG: Rab family GTPase [Candidatus Hodarchaeales archaeon]